MSKNQKVKRYAVGLPEWLYEVIDDESNRKEITASAFIRSLLAEKFADIRDEYENVDEDGE